MRILNGRNTREFIRILSARVVTYRVQSISRNKPAEGRKGKVARLWEPRAARPRVVRPCGELGAARPCELSPALTGNLPGRNQSRQVAHVTLGSYGCSFRSGSSQINYRRRNALVRTMVHARVRTLDPAGGEQVFDVDFRRVPGLGGEGADKQTGLWRKTMWKSAARARAKGGGKPNPRPAPHSRNGIVREERQAIGGLRLTIEGPRARQGSA